MGFVVKDVAKVFGSTTNNQVGRGAVSLSKTVAVYRAVVGVKLYLYAYIERMCLSPFPLKFIHLLRGCLHFDSGICMQRLL